MRRSPRRTKAFAPRSRNAASSSSTAPSMNAVARFRRGDCRPIRCKRQRSALPVWDGMKQRRRNPQSGRFRRSILGGRSTWPSRMCGAPSFVNGCHFRARNDNPVGRRLPSRNPRSNDMIYRAAGERRTTSSWHGCGRASDSLDLLREDDISRQRLPRAAMYGGAGGFGASKPCGSL